MPFASKDDEDRFFKIWNFIKETGPISFKKEYKIAECLGGKTVMNSVKMAFNPVLLENQ